MKEKWDLSTPWIQWVTLLLIAFTWGSSFILMKKGLLSFTSLEVAAYRIFIASFILLPIAIKNLSVYRNPKDLGWLFVVGFIGNFIPAFLFTKAQTVLNSSFTGMLNSTVPLFTLVIGLLFFQMKFKLLNLLGVVFGLTGVIGLIVANSSFSLNNEELSYSVLPILATVCYGTNVNLLKTRLAHLGAVQITALSFLLTGPIAAIYLAYSDFFVSLSTDKTVLYSLAAISALGIIGTALALILFNALIKHTSALFASAVTYMIPVFAIMWGLIDNESFNPAFAIWIVLILIGVYLVNKK